ncbi:MAG TPA: AAA family ATPase [Candidatus Dormibacteraeota bacterium]|nr:AAA family ATPase [Candidatus Dormibacteraeota bacterium]
MRVIERLLSEAREGRGRSLFIVAEVGLGKTTMVDRAQAGARGQFQISIGRGDAAESSLPFGIIDQALRGLGFRSPGDAKSVRRSALQARAARLYAALQFLEGLPSPTLLLLDDLHWADEDSLALLSYLCRRIANLPIALIGTLRPWPDTALDTVGPLTNDGDAIMERLLPLSETGAAQMLNDRAGGRISPSSARRAARLAAGNPLLLERMVMNVRRGQRLPESDGHAATTKTGLLRARFTGVSAEEKRYAQAAGVLGSRFRPMIATAMAELSPGEGDRALEALSLGGLLRSDASGWAQFAHPLLRQIVYDEIPPPMRAPWHARAFRLLVSAAADPAEAAEHAARSGLIGDQDAVAVLAQAGRRAMREGAIARAKQRLLAAVELAGSRAAADLLMDLGEVLLDSGDGRGAIVTFRRLLAMPDLTGELRSGAQRMLGRALFIRGAVKEAGEAFRVAVASALPSDKSEAVRALLDEAFISWPTGGPALATPLLERARDLAVDGSPRLRVRADTAWAFSTFVGGDPTGIAVIAGAVQDAFANPEADTTDFAWSWGTLGTYGNVTKWTEQFTDATRAYEIGMQAAERMGLPVAIAAVAVMHGDTCLRTGRLREALQLADRATMLADLAPERAFWAAIIHAYTLNEMGQMDECAEWYRRSSALADPNENWAGRVWLLHLEAVLAMHARRTADACALFDRLRALANQLQILEPCIVPWSGDAITAYLYGGRIQDALAIVASLDAMAERLPCRFPRIVAIGARAALKQAEGDQEASTRLLDEAIALATGSGMPLLEARIRHRLGALLRRSGHDRGARPLLKRAIELAEACGAEGLAKKAGDELKLAHGRQHRQLVDPDALTAAELRVRSLAEQGVRSRQIADQLFVSANTIETHLQHIYRKLGINSQRELVARARRPEPSPTPNGGDPPRGR